MDVMQSHTQLTQTTVTALADEKYLALTTFKKDGTPKSVPVWPVDAGEGRVGFVTSSQTWKVKRLANDARVELVAADARGRVEEGAVRVSGVAEVVDGVEFDALNAKVAEKYGFQLTLINFLHSLPGRRTGHANDRAIIVTPDI